MRAYSAQKSAARLAAIQTLQRGYDRYIVLGGQYDSTVGVIGHTPGYSNTQGTATITGYGNRATIAGQSTTTYTPGMPIIAGRHNQDLVIKMFRKGDPAGENAVDARRVLGPDWQKIIASKAPSTC